MSLKMTGKYRFFTGNNSLTANQARCGISFSLRYVGDPTMFGQCFAVSRNYYSGPWAIGQRTTGTKVRMNFAWPMNEPHRPNADLYFPPDSTQRIVMSFDQGAQWIYANGIQQSMGTEVGTTYGGPNAQFMIGGWDGPGNPNTTFEISDVAIWEGYSPTQQDVLDLRDGTKTPTDIGPSATRRVWWSLSGTPGLTPTIGQPGLNDFFGGINLAGIDGTGSAVYSPSLDWSPSVDAAPYVATSGEMVGFMFANKVNGSSAVAMSINFVPTVKINGIDVGSLASIIPWITGYHDRALIPLPVGVKVSRNDVVTISAPDGWMTTDSGLAFGFKDVLIENRVGRSITDTETMEKTLKIGINLSFGSVSVSNENTFKNLAKKHDRFANCPVDKFNYPTYVPGAWSMGAIQFCNEANGLDATGYPGPIGHYAIGWDDLDPSQGLDFGFSNEGGYVDTDAIMTTTHRADLDNPGTLVDGKRVGKVRVFDIQPTPGATSSQRLVRLKIYPGANHTPRYENLVVYGPSDFTYTDGVPVVLNKSNPYGMSQITKSRFLNAGTFRFVEATVGGPGSGQACEPEHLASGTDYSWARNIYYNSVGIKQARPFSLANCPYLYHFASGSKYDVILESSIDATQTTVTIAYDEANPVFAHLRLFAGGEVMRVLDIASGTLATGNVVTFNVVRGCELTTPSPHAAGTIQAGYRIPITSVESLAGPPAFILEFVADRPHGIWSGLGVSWKGKWPTFTYSDGGQLNNGQWGSQSWVTGPDRFACSGWSPTAGVTHLSQTYDLDPASCYSDYILPEGGGVYTPYEVAAHMTGEIPGADLWLEIGQTYSNDMVIEVARRTRDNFPAGRKIYFEYNNEPWNFGFAQWRYVSLMGRLLWGSVSDPYPYQMTRSNEIVKLLRDVFNEGGRNRGSEIVHTVNIISRPGPSLTTVFDYCLAQNPPIVVDAVPIAPYVNCPEWAADTITKVCQNRYTVAQCIDVYVHHLIANKGPASYPLSFKDTQARIDAYSAATGFPCRIVSYEGGVESPIGLSQAGAGSLSATNGSPNIIGAGSDFLRIFRPGDSISIAGTAYVVQTVADNTHLTLVANFTGATASGLGYAMLIDNSYAKAIDMIFHPDWYIAEHEFYAMLQRGRFTMFTTYRDSGTFYKHFFMWPMYNWYNQQPCRGDGSDGRSNNLLCQATPGYPHTKSATINIFEKNGSVRGQALIDWNRQVKSPKTLAVSKS